MRETAKTYFQVLKIIDLIVGILACITVAGAILGVPLIIASNKFKDACQMSDSQLVESRTSLFGWGIFSAIVLAPSVLLCVLLLFFVFSVNNYILDLEKGIESAGTQPLRERIKKDTQNAVNQTKEAFGVKSNLDKEREQLEKLKIMKDEGLLTEEEYAEKRKKILGID